MTFGEYLEREYAFFFKIEAQLHGIRFAMLPNCEKGTKLTEIMSLPLYDRFLNPPKDKITLPLIAEQKTAEEMVKSFNY
jgi:hypothetical protein